MENEIPQSKRRIYNWKLAVLLFAFNFCMVVGFSKYSSSLAWTVQTPHKQGVELMRHKVYSNTTLRAEKNKKVDGLPICTSEERMRYIRSTCSDKDLAKKQSPRMVVDHEREVAYCYVPKIACTTWKMIMANNTGVGPYIAPDFNPKAWIHTRLEQFGLRTELYSKRLENYTKFMVLRHPMDRYLSAYGDKARVRMHPHKNKLASMYVSIKKFAFENFDHSNLSEAEMDQYIPTLTEFIAFTKKQRGNLHWLPYFSRCGVCSIDYDYILRTESMISDCDMFLKQKYPEVDGCPMYNSYGSKIKKTKLIKSKHLDGMSGLDAEDMDYLVQRYSADMRRYGYQFDTDSLEASCSIERGDGSKCC